LADLSSLVADFEQQRACRQEAWRFYDVECFTLPLVPWQDADHWSAIVDLACDAPDVIGPRFDTVWARRALHVPQTDHYTMSIASGYPPPWSRSSRAQRPAALRMSRRWW
jgi:hypothetical protein